MDFAKLAMLAMLAVAFGGANASGQVGSQSSSINTFRDSLSGGGQGPEMVVIPAGQYLRGSPDGEGPDDTHPQSQVVIGYQFAVGKHEVTWEEYNSCVTDGGCASLRDDRFGGGRHPVTNVSWDEARRYTGWLSRKSGKTYRLLSEAEWEYAARAGSTTPYPWGLSVGSERANCDGCLGRKDSHQTMPVGSFEANGFGLHDMIGNVWEWVEDCYDDSFSAGQPNDGRAFTNGSCSYRVLRGGSWYTNKRWVLSVSRLQKPPSLQYFDQGFRIARTLP